MDVIDSAKAAQVWERVQGRTPEENREAGLGELITREWESAGTYLLLSRQVQGRASALLRKLSEQEGAHVACLKGIYTLITGKRPGFTGVKPGHEHLHSALRRCYGQQMQRLACYESRCNDPEYGHIFAQLAQQERQHCHIVLEVLGML